MWIRAMLLAFLFNGLAPFGLRVLAGLGVAETETIVYLFYWYLAGFALAAAWAFTSGAKISRSAAVVGAAMGAASVSGHASMGMALAHGVPGNVVFPIAVGANLFIVAAGGFLWFRERLGPYGKAGVAIGLLTAVLLALPE